MVYQPTKAIHPGYLIQRALDDSNMSQLSLAERTGLSPKHINEIIKGKTSLTVETALLLENSLGGSANFWINLEKNYQETLARIDNDKRAITEITLAKKFPYLEIVKAGFLSSTQVQKDRVKILWKFFGVNSLNTVELTESVAFRKRNAKNINPEALATWLRCGEIEASKLELPEYSALTLRKNLSSIKALSRRPDFGKPLQTKLAESGVGIVYIPHFKHTQINGATRWIGVNPLIQLSIFGKDADKFWFTLFHEVGHILNGHSKKETFLDFKNIEKEEIEKQADKFASNTLIPNDKFRVFVETGDITRDAIITFAQVNGISPGIVLGRLKHEEILDWAVHQDLHAKLEFTKD